MKRSLFTILLFISSASAWGANPQERTHQSTILDQISDLARHCVIQPYSFDASGKRTDLPLQSACSEIEQDGKMRAKLELQGERYEAVLEESEDSDGGDLDHLTILNAEGRVVASLRNVAAFDNILIALGGGQTQFPEVRAQ